MKHIPSVIFVIDKLIANAISKLNYILSFWEEHDVIVSGI
jgi:hypothetical protein